MRAVYLFVTMTNRGFSEAFSAFYKRHHATFLLGVPGNGTAADAVLSFWGLEATEKSILFTVAGFETCRELMRGLRREMNIDAPGNGIAMSIPLSSVGGAATLRYLTEGQQIETKEEPSMIQAPYELIIVVANVGCTNIVMDAARSAGATGGTVLHAKGAGHEQAEKFFGVSLADEREMIFIVTTAPHKNDIMKAVMAKAGMDSKAHSLVFSLPVHDVAGIRALQDEVEAQQAE